MMRGFQSERAVNFGGMLLLFAALAMSSCWHRAASAKAAAPVTPAAPKPVAAPAPAPPPPPPLSIPQTQVELPPPQPIDPAALATESASQDAQQPAARPAAGPRRAPANPAVTPPVAPATPPAATEPPREAIQEMISPTELKRLQDQAVGRRREVNQILEQLGKRTLPRTQLNVVTSIRNFLALSEEAEKRNDMRQADALAERAQILARDLQNGK